MEDKNIQKGPELTPSSSINIEPPKQESVSVTPHPVQAKPSASQSLVKDSGSINIIKPPETTQDVNIKRSKKEEKPEFLKHPPKSPDRRKKEKFMGTIIILSLVISACSIILLLFCIKDTAIPQFIQPAIDYLYKIAQNYL